MSLQYRTQFGECNAFDGQCHCPDGWGGIDCLTPRKPNKGQATHQESKLTSTKRCEQQYVALWPMPMQGTRDQTESNVNAKRGGAESTAMVSSVDFASFDISACSSDCPGSFQSVRTTKPVPHFSQDFREKMPTSVEMQGTTRSASQTWFVTRVDLLSSRTTRCAM